MKLNKIFSQGFFYNAPAFILCCGDPSVYPLSEYKKGIDDPFEMRAIRDLAMSTEHIVLRAAYLSLGTCYVS